MHVYCSLFLSTKRRCASFNVRRSTYPEKKEKKRKEKQDNPQNTPTYLGEDKKAHILLPQSLPNEHQSCVLPEPRKKNAAFVRSM
jgi:hypothetical protein